LVVAVAALAVTAGCTGGTDPATATPGNNSTTPDGPALEPMAQLDGAELTDATSAAVESAGSYTSHTESVFSLNTSLRQSRTLTNTTTRVDLDARHGSRTTTQTVAVPTQATNSAVVYTDGNTSYRRVNTSQGVDYATQTGAGSQIVPVNTTAYGQNYTVLTDSFEYEANGTATVAGTTTVRYTSTNLTDTSYFVGNSNATISNATSTMYVDADNVVRRASLSYTIEGTGGSSQTDLTITLTDIGSTTVEEPDWLSDAQSTETAG